MGISSRSRQESYSALPMRVREMLPRLSSPRVVSYSAEEMALAICCMLRPYWVMVSSSSSTRIYCRVPPLTSTSATPSIRSISGTILSST